MDPELKILLEQTHALAKDNHQMLRAIRRHQWYGVVWTVIVWLVILALPLYLYQQYMRPIIERFSTDASPVSGLLGLPSSAELQKLINSFKTGE